MRVVISQPMFFPWIGLFEQIKLCDIFVNYNDVQFSKGSFTNRVQVKAPSGSKWLTVPLKGLKFGQAINEIQIDNSKNWKSTHSALLEQSYKNAPFFSEMMTLLLRAYEKKHELIADLAYDSMLSVCEYFNLNRAKVFLNVCDLHVAGRSSQRVFDVCNKLNASTYITGHGAKNYLSHEMFKEKGISVEYMNYVNEPYDQLHGTFTPYVSILDLIANKGPRGSSWLKSGTVEWDQFVNERN